MPSTYVKDPDAILDYQIDWTAWLSDDTIESSEWLVPDGLTLGTGAQAPSNTTTTATCWLSGGTVGERYQVTNRITTAGGRTDDRTIQLWCLDR